MTRRSYSGASMHVVRAGPAANRARRRARKAAAAGTLTISEYRRKEQRRRRPAAYSPEYQAWLDRNPRTAR